MHSPLVLLNTDKIPSWQAAKMSSDRFAHAHTRALTSKVHSFFPLILLHTLTVQSSAPLITLSPSTFTQRTTFGRVW
jgi:hypothetical protein